jgi:Multiubiquitin
MSSEPAKHPRLVEISVNGKPVQIEGPKAMGRAIKEAAVAQGLTIQVNFVLSQVIGRDKRKVVGDTDSVAVNKNSEFIAVAPDDNS